MAYVTKIKIQGTAYDIKDKALATEIANLLAMTLPTGSQVANEKYWVPTTTDKTALDAIRNKKIVNMKGVITQADITVDLPTTLAGKTDAVAGDLWLYTNPTTSLTEEWIKTDTGWEMLGTVQQNVDITGKEDKTQVKALFDGFTVTLITGETDEYLITIPQCDNSGSIVTGS